MLLKFPHLFTKPFAACKEQGVFTQMCVSCLVNPISLCLLAAGIACAPRSCGLLRDLQHLPASPRSRGASFGTLNLFAAFEEQGGKV